MSGLEIVILIALTCSILLSIFTLLRFGAMQQNLQNYRSETTNTIQSAFSSFGTMLYHSQKDSAASQEQHLEELQKRFHRMQVENEQKLENIRQSMYKVTEGLGEMQSIAGGVADLKKVLSNVKTRGILGEVQLGAILEEVLAPEQYDQNVDTRGEHKGYVEFAVKMPGNGDQSVWLPIDSKFPGETYAALLDAYDAGLSAEIASAQRNLIQTLRREARDICEKYIAPPKTTNFGIMFLPFEGLYAEVVRLGMIEVLQREYHVNIAGPTTMAAMLNSLQMGFRTLAIEQHSAEVWEVLGAVKTEFDRFEEELKRAQKGLEQTSASLEKLVGTRTRMMRRKLREVEEMPQKKASEILLFEEEE